MRWVETKLALRRGQEKRFLLTGRINQTEAEQFMILDDFGHRLAQARQDGTNAAVNFSLVPDGATAETMQDAANLAYGGTPFGFKIGATNEQAQQLLGSPGPFFGVMVDTDRYDNGETIPWKDHFRGVECEFAFEMAQDFPVGSGEITEEAMIEAIGGCYIALEVVGRRTSGDGLPKFPGVIADFGAHCAFVLGPEIADWQNQDLAAAAVKGLSNGTVTNEGTGAAVMGHPLNAMLWLAETLKERGKKMEAGDIISTGTALGLIKPKPGALVEGDFGPFGKVSLKFGEAAAGL
jgi:2-keto-4-pentenoate hydratase